MHKTNEDMVSHPSHYNKGNPVYEPYKVIKAWDCNFNIGNAIKYLARYRNKWDALEDLEKAKQYIDFEIEALKEAGQKNPNCDGCAPKCDECYKDKECDCGDKYQAVGDEMDLKTKKIVEVVNEVSDAIEDGRTRVDIMRNILGMSDNEILDVVRMSDTDQCDEFKKAIARKAGLD